MKMNIKLLKLIVILMGIAIIIGIIILCIAIYYKFKNISSTSDKNTLSILSPNNMKYIKHEIRESKIFISYDDNEKVLISIYDIISGKKINQIEILK